MAIGSQGCTIDGSVVSIAGHIGGIAIEGIPGDEALL